MSRHPTDRDPRAVRPEFADAAPGHADDPHQGCGGPAVGRAVGGAVVSVAACGPFDDAEIAESAFDALDAEYEALLAENRLLKLEVRTLLDTIRCAGDVLEKLIEESK